MNTETKCILVFFALSVCFILLTVLIPGELWHNICFGLGSVMWSVGGIWALHKVAACLTGWKD